MTEDNPTAGKVVRKRAIWVRAVLYGLPLLLVGAIMAPNFVSARTTACKNACVNNLRQIDGATQQLSLEKKLEPGTPVNQNEVSDYIKGGWPTCPGGGVYTIEKVGALPQCSIGHTL